MLNVTRSDDNLLGSFARSPAQNHCGGSQLFRQHLLHNLFGTGLETGTAPVRLTFLALGLDANQVLGLTLEALYDDRKLIGRNVAYGFDGGAVVVEHFAVVGLAVGYLVGILIEFCYVAGSTAYGAPVQSYVNLASNFGFQVDGGKQAAVVDFGHQVALVVACCCQGYGCKA